MSDQSNILNLINNILSGVETITDDRSVKFNNTPYPKKGWAIFTCGGPGSGKSYAIKNQFLIDAKILDSDNLKILYIKLLKKILDNPNTDEETKMKILKPFNNKLPDPKNPKDMDLLHKYVSWKKHMFSKTLNNFLKSTGKNLQNVIIDSTGNDINEIILNTTIFKDIGYKVGLVWIITNIDLAKIRNKTRDRVVPEDYLVHVHNKVLGTIPNTIQKGLLDILDEIWILFSKNNEKSDFKSRFEDTAFKLEKIDNNFKLSDEMLQKITQHTGIGEVYNDQTY